MSGPPFPAADPERQPKDTPTADAPHLPLIAYPTSHRRLVSAEPAPRWRDWMNATEERWANRCLPLLVANQAGWVLLNPLTFTATWGGGDEASSLTLEYANGDVPPPRPVESHFGYGVVTWSVPYLFRTPPGYNLLARGPANWPKDGICFLEGLVETDWSASTFTMNWKMTRPDHPVVFEAGEPFCMIVPQRRGELESFEPEIRDISTDPETHRAAETWAKGRDQMQVHKFLSKYAGEFEPYRTAWEAHYFKGLGPGGEKVPEHQTQLRLAPFKDPDTPGPDEA